MEIIPLTKLGFCLIEQDRQELDCLQLRTKAKPGTQRVFVVIWGRERTKWSNWKEEQTLLDEFD